MSGSVSKLNRPIPSSAVGAGFACPKTQSKLFSGERTSPLRTKRQHYPRFDTFTFAVLNITIKYKCIFEKKSCSELTLTLVLNDYRLNQTATLLIGEPSQLEL